MNTLTGMAGSYYDATCGEEVKAFIKQSLIRQAKMLMEEVVPKKIGYTEAMNDTEGYLKFTGHEECRQEVIDKFNKHIDCLKK